MFDNLNANIVEATDEDIESAFGEDTTKVEKKKTDKKAGPTQDGGKVKKTTATSKEKPVLGSSKADTITDFSEEDVDSVFDTEEEEVEVEEDKEKDKSKKKKVDETPEEEEVEEEEEENEDEDNDDEKEENEEEEVSDDNVKDFLSARANLLIKKGEWSDFEGSDEFEWTEESFAEMELQQRAYQKTQMREELLESFGPYGKEIADYAAKGGDPDKLIDIFKEQQRVESLSIETEDDQRAVVMKYETEFLNKKPERVKKYIDSLIADKDLASEATEAKKAMEESLQTESDNLQAEQDARIKQNAQRQKENVQKFQSDVSGLVDKMDIPADEKKQLLQVLTKFDKKLKNGTPVNDFYFKFDQFRKDLPNYLKLVRFVLNPDKFIKSIENNGKSQATDKAFKLAMGANKSKKLKSAGADTSSDGKTVKTKFKLL